MNSGVVERTRLAEDSPENSEEFSPPESKRLRLDDDSNNDFNGVLNDQSKSNEIWSYSGDRSLVEPEILADMGVSMLLDDLPGESVNMSQSLRHSVPSTGPQANIHFETVNSYRMEQNVYRDSNLNAGMANRLELSVPSTGSQANIHFETVNNYRMEQNVYRDSNLNAGMANRLELSVPSTGSQANIHFETVNGYRMEQNVYRDSNLNAGMANRLEQELYELEKPAAYSTVGNESGYSSRIEIDNFIDTKENTCRNDLNASSERSDLKKFYLSRRRKRVSIGGEDKFNKLSDEMILMILKWLPKKCLVRSMLVCKRWCQIARDEALWSRLDLGGKVLSKGTLGHILPRGVQILRLAQAEIADPVFLENSELLLDGYISKLQYLDLSIAVISANGLAMLLAKCKHLKKLSLEKCTINKWCCKAISQNGDLEVLNLTMCDGMDIECISDLMKLKRLSAVNMGWCSLDMESIKLLCRSLPPSVTRLNISGCRKTMTDDCVRDLVRTCPDLVELDLSDCTLLTMNTVRYLLDLTKIEHLSLSRCYSIPPSTYQKLLYMPSLLYLDVFGLMSETTRKNLQACSGETQLNKFRYSSVARPTVGVRRSSIWGLRVRD